MNRAGAPARRQPIDDPMSIVLWLVECTPRRRASIGVILYVVAFTKLYPIGWQTEG